MVKTASSVSVSDFLFLDIYANVPAQVNTNPQV